MKTQVIMSFIVVMLESLAMCAPAWAAATVPAIASETATYYVDAANGDDSNSGLSPDTAFATIQEGIDTTGDGDTVMVYPGIYTEGIRFRGKAITVQSATDGAVLQNPDDFAVAFYYGEGPDSVLKNFVIRNSLTGIFIAASSPTISNVTVVNNEYGVEAYGGAEPHISNSIIWDNTGADLIGCQASYSWVQQEVEPEPLEGLISHWKFDEASGTTAYDSAGDNDANVYGATWTSGVIDGALDFNGVSDYADCGNSFSSVTGSTTKTIMAWAKPDTADVGARVLTLYRRGDYYSAFSLYARVSSGPATWTGLYATSGNGYDVLDSGITVNTGVWAHVALVQDGADVHIYVNGVLKNSASNAAAPVISNPPNATIGAYKWYDDLTLLFDGKIDDVRIYDRALSAEDVERLYENGLDANGSGANPLFADPANGDYHLVSERGRYRPEPEGLVSLWKFDEAGGTTAYDSAGNNHGTIHGAQWSTGQVGGALEFDGVDDYVDCGNSSAFAMLGDMSVSLWFNRALTLAPKDTLIAIEGGDAETEVENAVFYLRLLSADTGGADMRYIHEYDWGMNEEYDFDADIAPDSWTHVAVVRDACAKTVKMYMNENLVDVFEYYMNPTSTNEEPTAIIGARYGGTYNFEGAIDEVSVYDRALTAEEVQQLYQIGLDGSGSGANPLFADPANGDYHLLSERGRYWPEHDVWVLDKVTSPCIDGGDPDTDYSNEPTPNGGRINMGAYGGTAYASMSEAQWFDPDVNGDGVVDISDILELIDLWLEAAGWGE